MERCERCSVSGNEIRIFDAICEGRMISLCERCSIVENVPIIKKPDSSQLKASEQGVGVYDRMKRIGGVKDVGRKDTFFQEDKLKELEENPEMESPEKKKLNLVEHFHWDVMKNRRRKGLSQKQLADVLGESEIAIQMIEAQKLPENAESVIKKLEQFFQIKIKKISDMESRMVERVDGPVLLDEAGRELEIIPEEESIFVERVEEVEKNEIESYADSKELERFEGVDEKDEGDEFGVRYYPVVKKKEGSVEGGFDSRGLGVSESSKGEGMTAKSVELPSEIDIRKVDIDKVKIRDLREIHRKKIEVTKQERLEEQRKIEERQRILEALREKDRMKAEQKKREEMMERQRVEDERNRLIEEKKRELQEIRNREARDLDSVLGGMEVLGKNRRVDGFEGSEGGLNDVDRGERLEDADKVEEFDRELV